MIKLKNGRYKDFTCLAVDYEIKTGKRDALYNAIISASITSGLKRLTKKQERAMIYNDNNDWIKLVEILNN